MTFSTVAIIASNDPSLIKSCLQHLEIQKPPITEKIVIPWGDQSSEVRRTATSFKAVIMDPSKDNSFESNRNLAIEHIRADMSLPEYVLFLDDDAFLDDDWHEHAQTIDSIDRAERTYATVVAYNKHKNILKRKGLI